MTKYVKYISALTLAVMVALPLGAHSAGPVQKVATEPQAKPSRAVLGLKETSHDFGTIMEGESVEHVFVITNSGEGELTINAVKPG